MLFSTRTSCPRLTLRHPLPPPRHCRLVYVLCVPHPQLTLPYVLNICVQLTSGLLHLHAACGVLHRDLKTDNALVAGKDPLVVKWADFGCSVKLMGGATSTTYGNGACECGCGALCLSVAAVAVAFGTMCAHTNTHRHPCS